MASYKPMTRAQYAARDVFMNDLPLLDNEFDPEFDSDDEHAIACELTNQFTTHNYH